MDASRFDSLTRLAGTGGSRRRVVAGLLAGAISLLGGGAAHARRCTENGTVCRENANCCSGFCGRTGRPERLRCACPDGFTECEGTCVDFQTDPANCGGCGNVCDGGRTCAAGVCGCDGVPCDCGCVNVIDGPAVCVGEALVACNRPCTATVECGEGALCASDAYGYRDCATDFCATIVSACSPG